MKYIHRSKHLYACECRELVSGNHNQAIATPKTQEKHCMILLHANQEHFSSGNFPVRRRDRSKLPLAGSTTDGMLDSLPKSKQQKSSDFHSMFD